MGILHLFIMWLFAVAHYISTANLEQLFVCRLALMDF